MEIERKFLVKDNSFMEAAFKKKHIRQGFICADRERSVRIRIAGNEAYLTIKNASDERGWSRYEFEIPLSSENAREMIKLCLPEIIEKVRHYVEYKGHTWEVDVFFGENEGLTVAEIELESENDTFELPAWIDREVSGDARYYNAVLSKNPYSKWPSQQ
ncbi:MAG: CYTH domain-containing protein [Tannerella sp.]|jgi:CYTH domain-containing protein|nr:CYTH domain-containing protein [Tannerella sp.]